MSLITGMILNYAKAYPERLPYLRAMIADTFDITEEQLEKDIKEFKLEEEKEETLGIKKTLSERYYNEKIFNKNIATKEYLPIYQTKQYNGPISKTRSG